MLCFTTNICFGQDYNRLAESAAKEQKIPKKDLKTFKEKHIASLKKAIKNDKTYLPIQLGEADMCDDGGFETKDFSNWTWKMVDNRKSGNAITFNAVETGTGTIHTSTISSSTTALSQWEIVSTGYDDLFPTLPKVHSGKKALKLGRKENPGVLPYCSAESIDKTVTITAANSQLTFWYALVLQDPFQSSNTHTAGQAPAFGVRVKAGSTTYVPILPAIVNASTTPIEALNNPFLLSGTPYPYQEAIAMRPWTCGRVDLSGYIGQTITIEFIVNDCTHAGHFGYAYLDDICMGCQGSDMGDASLKAISKDCGPDALVSGSYSLPYNSASTGTLTSLQASLYQNGLPVAGQTVTIPLTNINTTNKTFSFPMSLFSGVPAGSYDIVIKATFQFLTNPIVATSANSGVNAGINNDWKSVCSANPCCQNTLKMVSPIPVPPSYPFNGGTYSVEYYNVTTPSNVPITEIKVEVTSFEWLDGPEDCKQCQIKTSNLGSIFGGISIGGVLSGPTLQPYGNGIAATSNNNEVIFSFPNGKIFNVGDYLRLTYILPPEKNLSCCQTKAKVCRKITWRDSNCNYCEVYDCSTVDLKNKSELKQGSPLPDLLMLYLNSRGIFATGHADGF